MQEEEKKDSPPSTDDSPQQDAQLNIPSTDETIVPAETSNIINPTSDIKDMEVHHHTHDPAAPHHKKNWKNYFWEFLMLFLAVFCGFLAEYQLEQTIERHREKEFMTSLYQDLKTDTSNLSSLIIGKKDEITTYDSVVAIFKSKRYLQETSGAYYYGRRLIVLRLFYPADGTITQLVNAGGLRLIRSRNVVDSIQSYRQDILVLKNIQVIEAEHFVLARSLMGKIFDADVFDRMIDLGLDSNTIARPDKSYPLMPFTRAELNDFHVPISLIKRNKISQIGVIERLQRKALNIMKMLEEEYKVHKQ